MKCDAQAFTLNSSTKESARGWDKRNDLWVPHTANQIILCVSFRRFYYQQFQSKIVLEQKQQPQGARRWNHSQPFVFNLLRSKRIENVQFSSKRNKWWSAASALRGQRNIVSIIKWKIWLSCWAIGKQLGFGFIRILSVYCSVEMVIQIVVNGSYWSGNRLEKAVQLIERMATLMT